MDFTVSRTGLRNEDPLGLQVEMQLEPMFYAVGCGYVGGLRGGQ